MVIIGIYSFFTIVKELLKEDYSKEYIIVLLPLRMMSIRELGRRNAFR